MRCVQKHTSVCRWGFLLPAFRAYSLRPCLTCLVPASRTALSPKLRPLPACRTDLDFLIALAGICLAGTVARDGRLLPTEVKLARLARHAPPCACYDGDASGVTAFDRMNHSIFSAKRFLASCC